jgi:hypothetical protein
VFQCFFSLAFRQSSTLGKYRNIALHFQRNAQPLLMETVFYVFWVVVSYLNDGATIELVIWLPGIRIGGFQAQWDLKSSVRTIMKLH